MKFDPRVFRLHVSIDVGDALARLSTKRGLVLLDSAAGTPRRWGLLAFEPLRGVEAPQDAASLRACVGQLAHVGEDFVPGPFHGGFIGALSYDLGVHGEPPVRCGPDPWCTPLIVGGLYTDFIVRDEVRGEAWLVLGDQPGDDRPSVEERRSEIESLLSLAESAPEIHPTGPLLRHTSAREHCLRIERARELIAAGEFYQANLSHRFTRSIAGDPIDIYRRLRAVNPAPYMAYVSWDQSELDSNRRSAAGERAFSRGALLSASPELLFEFDGRVARTRPIKGTVARGKTAIEDERLAKKLLASEKDGAELAMIVDLERNDLGRIARPGSVRVERFAHLESYASVHHLSADVVAHPRDGVDAVDILCALFPGGSITGAPKLASMDAIAALEGEGRGFFTGSAGFIDTRGNACFNILIRTLVWRPIESDGPSPAPTRRERDTLASGEISFNVGSGITWSSVAQDEDRETLAKGAALESALEMPSKSISEMRAVPNKSETRGATNQASGLLS